MENASVRNNTFGRDFPFEANGRGNFRGCGCGRGRNGRNFKPQCQICRKLGHTAAVCYFRAADQNFGPQNPTNSIAQFA